MYNVIISALSVKILHINYIYYRKTVLVVYTFAFFEGYDMRCLMEENSLLHQTGTRRYYASAAASCPAFASSMIFFIKCAGTSS